MSSTLTINRTSEYVNGMRKIKIFLDNRELISVLDGESVSIDIPDGSHEIYAQIDWAKTKMISFNTTKEEWVFELGSNIRGLKKFLLLIYLFLPGKYIYLKKLN